MTVLLLLASCDFSSNIDVGCNVTELIDAINTANSNSSHTTINLDDTCLYNLIAVDNYVNNQDGFAGDTGATGLPAITTPITIEGHDAIIQRLTTASPPDFRIFFVTHTGDLTLNDVSILNGSIQGSTFNDGGGIYVNEGVLTLNRSLVMDNFAEDSGGGIVNVEGTVNIHDSSISFNEANQGGAIYNRDGTIIIDGNSLINDNSAVFDGGGVSNLGDLLIVNSTITGNTAQTEGGGVNNQGELTIQDSTISSNSSVINGGGLNSSSGTLTITGSTIHENETSGNGGGLSATFSMVTIDGSSIFDWNSAQDSGGGIYNGQDSTLLLEDSTIESNFADVGGGGIDNSFGGEMTISTSTIYANGGFHGGGVSNSADLLITQTTINDNTAVSGGGIRNGGLLTMINSTVSDNEAEISGGIYIVRSDTIIVHSTIVHNFSPAMMGTGLHVDPMATLEIKNSIVAFNYPLDCHFSEPGTAVGENLDSDGTCEGFTITADPLIDRLDDNGGPTFTHALLASSPALDAATNCPITIDQRDASRLPGPECDLGAYEDSIIFIPPTPPQLISITITPTPSVYWCEDILGVTILEGGMMRIQLSTPGLPAGIYNATVGKYDFTCKTYYDEYPDRLFCDGPKGEGGTMTTLTIFDPLGIPFCEETFSIPARDVPDKPDEPQACHSGLSQIACIAAGGKWNISTNPPSCNCPP